MLPSYTGLQHTYPHLVLCDSSICTLPPDLVCLMQLGTLNRQYVVQEIGKSGHITLSLLGGTCQMSMAELSTMQVPDFAKLWTVSPS